MVTLSISLYTAFFMVSHLFRFGGKPAGLLCSMKQEEGAVLPEQMETKILDFLVTADGGRSERLPTWLSCLGKGAGKPSNKAGKCVKVLLYHNYVF